jgi:hypothetical protein
MDPRGWNAEMDMAISVGLGVGNKREQAASMMQALEVSERLAMSPFASLVNKRNVYKQVKKLYHALGIKNTDDYLTEPDENEQEPPAAPSPEAIKAQAEAQSNAAKLQLEQQKSEAQMNMAREKAQMDAEFARERAAAEIDLAREKAAAELQLAREKAAAEVEMARERMAMEFQLEDRRVEHDGAAKMKAAESKLPSNRPGGDLDK